MMANDDGVLTHSGPDRRYRMCLCSVCKEVQQCVPVNDFYVEPPAEGDTDPKPLICSGCFRKSLNSIGLKPSDQVEL